jgi:Ni/Co efflux regulator RcnB
MKATRGNRRLLALLLSAAVATAATAQEQERKAKSAVDDRADPKARLADVGKGTHMARQPLKPGAYFNDKAREAVHAYYAAQKGKRTAAPRVWKIGESLPAGAAQGAVPPALLARLPRLPPGHRYVQVGSDVVLIAAGSKMVVDGIDAVPR